GLTVVARGAGTKLDWGAPPSRLDLVVDTGRLAGVHRHAAGDLVATVGAGTPLRAVQAALGEAGQRVALDPPSRSATVGGVLATGESGPLRLQYGTPRDLLIGVEFVRADGVMAHSGGQVVKNVAGYDLGKLMCGSYGTLGVVTSATLRLHPLPAARLWVLRTVRSALEVHDLVGRILAGPLAPAAIEVDLPAGAATHSRVPRPRPTERGETGTIAVLFEGSTAGATARAGAVTGLLGPDLSTVDEAPSWGARCRACRSCDGSRTSSTRGAPLPRAAWWGESDPRGVRRDRTARTDRRVCPLWILPRRVPDVRAVGRGDGLPARADPPGDATA